MAGRAALSCHIGKPTLLNSQMRRIFKGCPDAQQKDMLNELLVDHYSNTLFLVWQRSAVKGKIYDKEQAIKYLMRLLLIQ